MRPGVPRSLICILLAAQLTAAGCRPPPSALPASPAPGPAIAASAPVMAQPPGGRPQVPIAQAPDGHVTVSLPDPKALAGTITAAPLPDAEAQALLARLPPLPAATAGPAPALPPPAAPPPRAGTVQPIAFAIATGKPVADAPIAPIPQPAPVVPLAPPEITPQAEVAAESEVRIRFSEPMVPVAQVGPIARAPAAISPALPGTWRWIDTRVLTFTTSAPRFPGASQIDVSVPAGLRAVSGAVLAEPVRTSFTTRPVQISGVFPLRALRPDAPLSVTFDQRVDPAHAAAQLAVVGPGGAPLPFRAITLAEALPRWRIDPSLSRFIDEHKLADQPGPHVILAPQTAWPAGITGRVVLKRGTRSLEGARVTEHETSASFHVVAPFTVHGISCAPTYEPRIAGPVCSAGSYATVELSNSPLPSALRPDSFQLDGESLVDPRTLNATIGFTVPPRTGRAARATVTIGEGLVDVHGQPLRGPRQLSLRITPATGVPSLEATSGLIVLDPRFQIPQWVVHTEAVTSVRVQLYRVQPRDYFDFVALEGDARKRPPGRLIADQTHAVGPRHGAHLRVDLRPALGAAGLGHVVAVATAAVPGAVPRDPDESWRRVAWIQVTKLGVTARTDPEKVYAWVQDVSPAQLLAPRAGVEAAVVIEGRPGAARATTDAAGHAAFELPAPPRQPQAREPLALLVASTAEDSTFTTLDGPFERATRNHQAYWYATDDRFTYRPGERVHVKGWVRWTHDGVNPDLSLPAAGDTIAYTLTDARGNQLASGRAPLSDHGGFDLSVALPPNANLGTARFELSTRGVTHAHAIAIQEFRPPAYAVALTDDVTHSGVLPLVLGESIEMSAAAHYYAGGGLPGAKIEWTAQLASARYAPPGWDEFSFTPAEPRRDSAGDSPGDNDKDTDRDEFDRHAGPVNVKTAGMLSGSSSASIVYGIAAVPRGWPALLTVDAVVVDVDRARIRATSRPILVHPSSYYVGLRPRPGPQGMIEAIATDIDGNAVRGVAIDVELEGVLRPGRARGTVPPNDVQRCRLTSEAAPVACPFQPKVDHAYTATARVADARGRASATAIQVPSYASADRSTFAVVPDRAEYRPGDVAKLDIRSNEVPATAIVTFARQGVLAQRRVELTKPSTIIELPIEAALIQNVHVVVDRFIRYTPEPIPPQPSQPPATPQPPPAPPQPLPSYDTVHVDLPISLQSARLAMRVRPTRPLVEPGAPATFEVEVRHGGKPVAGAEVALIVVDEAVLAVSARTFADPLAPFYHHREASTWGSSSLPLVQDAGDDLTGAPGVQRYELDEEALSRGGFGSGHAGMSGRSTAVPSVRIGSSSFVELRKDFRPDAAFSPRLRTGPDGKVSLTVDMPDSLTRFRIVALASSGTYYFGKAEGTLVTQRKINARTVAPRFLTQGDTFSLPVVVQNLDAAPRTVDVAVRAANLATIGPAARRVTLPAGQRAEVRFALATQARGRATIQTIVASHGGGGATDASSIELPVYEPATTEAFATYGTVDDATRFEQLAVPTDVFPDVGGVEVELASTQLQSLTDAYWYLYSYPYGCAEQRSARMIATAAMYDVLEAFAAPRRSSRAEIDAAIKNDLRVLLRQQRADGGWGYFRDLASDPFVTLQVLTALTAHRQKTEAVTRAAAFAERLATSLLAGLAQAAAAPAARRPERGVLAYRIGLAAYALTALAGTGTDVRARAERLHALATALGAYSLDAQARLLALVAKLPRARAMRERLLGALVSATHETAATATVTTRFEEQERLLLVSSMKTTALALDALLREAPDHGLVTKLVRGLLDGRHRGRWTSTQENLVVLTALRRYFDTHEKTTPAFTGKVWLGDAAYAEQAFAGRSGARGTAHLGWAALAPGRTHDIALAKAGEGRMYYRVGIAYAPKQQDLPALDAGFIVRRTYAAIDDPADVVRTPDGRWKLRLGARVQVTVEAVNTTARHAVALVDPLPAGLEAVNESLVTMERAAHSTSTAGWDHLAHRDNRIEAFSMELAPGRHQLSYTARATTPGAFFAAPAKAEEMYSPETFGRSTGAAVLVE